MVVIHSMALQPVTQTAIKQLSDKVYTYKARISYVHQEIVSVYGTNRFEFIHTVDDVKRYIFNGSIVNVPLVPDYSGQRVDAYYDTVKICYRLLLQRQYLSRDNVVFKFITKDQVSLTAELIKTLHLNCNLDGIYNKARIM